MDIFLIPIIFSIRAAISILFLLRVIFSVCTVSFLVGLIVSSIGILHESIQWTGFLTWIAITSRMGRLMWSLIQVFFIVPITIYTFFRGVYDFGPKCCKRTFIDILLNPVPGIEFEGRLGKTDDFNAFRCRRFNHNNIAHQIARNRRLNAKRTTRSIASTVHNCPISYINSAAPQLCGYQSYFTLNDDPMGKRGTEEGHSMPMMLYFAICNFSCPDIVFSALPRMPPKGVITAFIVRAIITIFFGRIVFRTSIRLTTLRIRQMKCPSWKDIARLFSFLRESTSHATSLFTMIAAHSTLAASAQLSDLSFFDTDSSFWVCDNSATGHICKDKSLFTGDLVPSIFEVGSATGILTPTLMGTVILRLTDDEGATHSFEFTNVNYFPDSPVNLLSLCRLAELYPDATGHPD